MRTLTFRTLARAAAGALALAAGCGEPTSVPDLNNLPSTTIANGLTSASFPLLITGLANSDRNSLDFRYIVFTETPARDIYNLDPSENRFITELLGPEIDPSGFTGGGVFSQFYNEIATANTLVTGIPGLQSNGTLSAQDAAASLGFVQTLKALALYRVFSARGPNGVVADATGSTTAPLPPVLCQTSALTRISALLDSGYTNLQAGGATFPFTLPSGFSSNGPFSTPAGFAKFNRGLAGRTEVYRGILGRAQSYADAITRLNASFLNPTGDLTTGVYYTYSTAANETANPIAVPTIYLNPQVNDSLQAGDLRASKIRKLSAARTLFRVTSQYKSTLADPANQTSPIPVLRNAELVLLRAQANIGLGNLAAATSDINAVHTVEGGLTGYPTFTSPNAAIRAVLYEKRYSLLLTGAQRLVDLRSYGLLNAQNFKQEITLPAPDAFNSALPIPKQEADARGGNITLQCS